MDISWNVLIFFLAGFCTLTVVHSLSGHVCTREKAENYLTSYNQAFLCQERYTTSCGQLDWRRCTKYRVQTCFTPKQRYMIRYRQVEECCSGWREDGAGQCTVPFCSRQCQNGGSCVDVGNMPGCLCEEGFTGDACEHARNEWTLWYTVGVASGAVVLIVVIIISIMISYHLRKNRSYQRLPQHEFIAMNSPRMIGTYTTRQTQPGLHHNDIGPTDDVAYPTAPTPKDMSPD